MMKFLHIIVPTIFYFFGLVGIGYSQEKFLAEFQKDSIVSSLDGNIQRFFYYRSVGEAKNPLVVFLHQWSASYVSFKNSLATQAIAKNWNYIQPDFRGPNNHIKACGSKYVTQDIDEAIDWALRNLPVDKANIYLVGASGGGYATLCSFMKSRHYVKEYSVWVPITDIKRWYFESKTRGLKYADDIVHCTCDSCKEIDFEEVIRRSPLYWETPVSKLNNSKLKIYAGVHDGFTGAVPIIHSVSFYNKIVTDLKGSNNEMVAFDDLSWMLTTRSAPGEIQGKLGDRDILYYKCYKNVSLTIFEGSHEILVDEVLPKE